MLNNEDQLVTVKLFTAHTVKLKPNHLLNNEDQLVTVKLFTAHTVKLKPNHLLDDEDQLVTVKLFTAHTVKLKPNHLLDDEDQLVTVNTVISKTQMQIEPKQHANNFESNITAISRTEYCETCHTHTQDTHRHT